MAKLKLRSIAGPVFAAVLFCLAVRLLWGEIKSITWEEFRTGLTNVPMLCIAIAALLIAMNYALLCAYDLLALRYIARSIPLRRVAMVSFLGFSLGNNLGTLLAGTPIRFRFYSLWGLSPRQIVVLISTVGITFWSGLWFLGGVVLVTVPIELPEKYQLPISTQKLGLILLTLALTYSFVCILWRKPWPIGKIHVLPPEPGLMAVQASVAAVDLLISATGLYLVLPSDAQVGFPIVLAAYLLAIAASLISQVPGGLGVLEVILMAALKESVGTSQLIASLLIFRTLYYLLPLMFGMVLLAGYEIYGGALEARNAANADE